MLHFCPCVQHRHADSGDLVMTDERVMGGTEMGRDHTVFKSTIALEVRMLQASLSLHISVPADPLLPSTAEIPEALFT